MLRFSFLILFLGGCGFSPLYESKTSSYALKIATMPDREGQILKNELLVLFPQPKKGGPVYVLEPVLSFDQQSLGLRRDATAKRQTLTAQVMFKLVNPQGRAVYQDRVVVSTGYNVASSTQIAAVSLVASEKDARTRVLQQASQEIKILVESYLSR